MKSKLVLGVIPARIGSTRLSRKMLANINGKPLLYYTYNQAKKAKTLTEVVIATDSKEIFNVAKEFGAKVIMTSSSIKSGSDRVAVACKKFKEFIPDVVVNIQGDEPLMPVDAIDSAVKAIITDDSVFVSTPATPFRNKKDIKQPGFVKVVLDKNRYALYFSRSVIPFPREKYDNYFKHLGLYVYRRDFLYKYTKMRQTVLEKTEKLEQLRILENGYKIKVVIGNFNNMEVNTPEELKRVRQMIK